MRRCASSGEDVDHDDVGGPDEPGGHLRHDVTGVSVPHSDRGVSRPGQFGAHQVDQLGLEFDHLLTGAGSGLVDVAGECESAAAEVHRGERFARHPHLVDDVPDALDVLEEQLTRVV